MSQKSSSLAKRLLLLLRLSPQHRTQTLLVAALGAGNVAAAFYLYRRQEKQRRKLLLLQEQQAAVAEHSEENFISPRRPPTTEAQAQQDLPRPLLVENASDSVNVGHCPGANARFPQRINRAESELRTPSKAQAAGALRSPVRGQASLGQDSVGQVHPGSRLVPLLKFGLRGSRPQLLMMLVVVCVVLLSVFPQFGPAWLILGFSLGILIAPELRSQSAIQLSEMSVQVENAVAAALQNRKIKVREGQVPEATGEEEKEHFINDEGLEAADDEEKEDLITTEEKEEETWDHEQLVSKPFKAVDEPHSDCESDKLEKENATPLPEDGEDWNAVGSGGAEETAPVQVAEQNDMPEKLEEETKAELSATEKVSLFAHRADEANSAKRYAEAESALEEAEQAGLADEPEFIWRRARAKYQAAKSTDEKAEQKTCAEEGLELARKCLELLEAGRIRPDFDEAADIHKWVAIMQSEVGEHNGTKAKIAGANEFRQHTLKALELRPDDPDLHHMSGRFCFEVSNVSWTTRKLAKMAFGGLPETSFEEAMRCFYTAKTLKPSWLMNRLWLSKALLKLKHKHEAKQELTEVAELPAVTQEEKKALEEVADLLSQM